MVHLIDKNALVAEIEKRKSILDVDSLLGQGGMIELEFLKNNLDTLEVKEVDLKKEIDKVWETDYEDFGISEDDFYRVTRYFFELGLKAQKGE